MKKFLITAIVAVAAISGVIGYNETVKTQRSAIDMANIDVLTESEISDPRYLCDTYCRIKAGYICVLYTNYGFTINCDESVSWSYIN